MTWKMILLNIAPFVVILLAIFLFIEPKEQPILLITAFGMALLWACVIYSLTMSAGFLVFLKRKIFGVFRKEESKR